VKQVFEAGQKVIKEGSGFVDLLFGGRMQDDDSEEGSSHPAYGSYKAHDDVDSTARARPRRGRKN